MYVGVPTVTPVMVRPSAWRTLAIPKSVTTAQPSSSNIGEDLVRAQGGLAQGIEQSMSLGVRRPTGSGGNSRPRVSRHDRDARAAARAEGRPRTDLRPASGTEGAACGRHHCPSNSY